MQPILNSASHADLPRQAAQCRKLALGALHYDLVRELEALADEYDRRIAANKVKPGMAERLFGLFRR